MVTAELAVTRSDAERFRHIQIAPVVNCCARTTYTSIVAERRAARYTDSTARICEDPLRVSPYPSCCWAIPVHQTPVAHRGQPYSLPRPVAQPPAEKTVRRRGSPACRQIIIPVASQRSAAAPTTIGISAPPTLCAGVPQRPPAAAPVRARIPRRQQTRRTPATPAPEEGVQAHSSSGKGPQRSAEKAKQDIYHAGGDQTQRPINSGALELVADDAGEKLRQIMQVM